MDEELDKAKAQLAEDLRPDILKEVNDRVITEMKKNLKVEVTKELRAENRK